MNNSDQVRAESARAKRQLPITHPLIIRLNWVGVGICMLGAAIAIALTIFAWTTIPWTTTIPLNRGHQGSMFVLIGVPLTLLTTGAV